MERRWPRSAVCLPDALPELEWLAARDGSLSARHVDRQWFGDCSVPARAAQRMFARLHVESPTAILLAPTHAQQVCVVLERMRSDQALIVVQPGELTAGVIVACADFATAINAGRLWFAVGPDWSEELQAIFDRNEGIAPASLMIRVPGLNAEMVDAIQKPCEQLLARHAQSHRQRVELLMTKPRFPRTPAKRLCVGTGAFALWNDSDHQLNELMACADPAIHFANVDASEPTQRSALNFARVADGCDAIVTANVGRSDRAGLVPGNVPWTTWATLRVPTFDPKAPGDALVIAEESLRAAASDAGWPASHVRVGCEPTSDLPPIAADARVAIVADLVPITLPTAIEEMSSHRVIWDAVERDLVADPLRIGTSAECYLSDWCDRVGVPFESFPAALVLQSLIAPLFVREVTRQLVRRGAPINIWGNAWQAVEDVRPMWRGPIGDRASWLAAMGRTTAIVDLWPLAFTHPARRCGRAVLSVAGRSWRDLLASCKAAPQTPTAKAQHTFSLDELASYALADAA